MIYCPFMRNMSWGMPYGSHTHMPPSNMYMEQGMQEYLENIFAEDDRDDEYFDSLHPESCKKIMPYIDRELDKMETEESPLYEEYPDKKMLEHIGDRIYDRVVSDMPEMEEHHESRQFGRRRLLRDLIGILLLTNLGRRRRRRRRRYYDYNNDYGYNY